jgi:hypothetical protein
LSTVPSISVFCLADNEIGGKTSIEGKFTS